MNVVGPAVALAMLGLGALVRVAVVRSLRHRVRVRLPRALTAPPCRSNLTGSAPRWFASALEDAAIGIEPDRAWAGAVAGVCALAAFGALVGGPPLLLLAAAAGSGGVAVVLRSRRGRSAALLEQALPGALEAVARSLRSGGSLRAAVAEATAATGGRLGRELRQVDVELRRGVPVVRALDEFAVRVPSPGVRLAVAALGVGIETGGAQARAIDGVATTLRDRLAAFAEARALSAQTRASVWVIAISPAIFCAFAISTDPRTAGFFFRSKPGLMFLAAGLALDGAGALWMQRLSSVDR